MNSLKGKLASQHQHHDDTQSKLDAARMEQDLTAKKLAACESELDRAADAHRQTQAALSESEDQLSQVKAQLAEESELRLQAVAKLRQAEEQREEMERWAHSVSEENSRLGREISHQKYHRDHSSYQKFMKELYPRRIPQDPTREEQALRQSELQKKDLDQMPRSRSSCSASLTPD